MKEPEDRAIRAAFSLRLRLCRKANRLTQAQLAEKLEALGESIHYRTISHYEQAVSMPDLVRATKLAFVLRVSINYLCGLVENPKG